jgi:hypothetical protein
MFRFKESAEGLTKAQILDQAVKRFEELPDRIPFLKVFEVGRNINTGAAAYDLLLNSEFENEDQLNQYQVHPAHEEIKGFLGNLREDIAVVDYEV